MTGFQLYRIYLAIKLHFTTQKYDVFEMRGRVKATESGFINRRGRGAFDRLTRKLNTPQEAVQFFVANAVYNTSIFESSVAEQSWKTWIKNKEMMTELIVNDIDKISEQVEIELTFDGEVPQLIKMYNRNEIHIETIVALSKIYNFLSWSNWKNNLCFPELVLKLGKMNKFVSFNEERVKKKLYECNQVSA